MTGKKVQGQVPDYHDFVISQLINIEGTSRSDVVARIIGFWIRENTDRLSDLGITPELWRAYRSTKERPTIVPYSKGAASKPQAEGGEE